MTSAVDRIVFCEGQEDGLDLRMLNALRTEPNVEFVPYGSKYDLTSFVRGHVYEPPRVSPFGTGTVPPAVRYLVLRDRDFDYEPVASSALIPIQHGIHSGRVFAWYRHEVESYIVEPKALDAYFRERDRKRKQAEGPLPSLPQIEAALDRAATKLAPYQAARWALGRVNRSIETHDRRGRATTWAEPHDVLPEDLSEPACRQGLQSKVEEYRSWASQIVEPQAQFEQYLQHFTTASFMRQREYLVWFSGKNLLQQFWRELQLPGGAGSYHVDLYRKQAPNHVASLDPLPPDLKELQQKIASL